MISRTSLVTQMLLALSLIYLPTIHGTATQGAQGSAFDPQPEQARRLAQNLSILAQQLRSIKATGTSSAKSAAQLLDILMETIGKTPAAQITPIPSDVITILQHFIQERSEETPSNEVLRAVSQYDQALLQKIVAALGELIAAHPQGCAAICEQLQILNKVEFNPSHAATVVQDTGHDRYTRSVTALFLAQCILRHDPLLPASYAQLGAYSKAALIHALGCFAEKYRPQQSPSIAALHLQASCLEKLMQLGDSVAISHLDRYHKKDPQQGYAVETLQEDNLLDGLRDLARIIPVAPAAADAAQTRVTLKSAKKKNTPPAVSTPQPARSQKEIAAEVERLLTQDKELQRLLKQEQDAAAKKRNKAQSKKRMNKEHPRGADKPTTKMAAQNPEQEAQQSNGDHTSATPSCAPPTSKISTPALEESWQKPIENADTDHTTVDGADQQSESSSEPPTEVLAAEQEKSEDQPEQLSRPLNAKERRKLKRAAQRLQADGAAKGTTDSSAYELAHLSMPSDVYTSLGPVGTPDLELFKAASYGSFREVSSILSKYKIKPLAVDDFNGYSALHAACFSGDLRIIDALRHVGFNPLQLNTALHSPIRLAHLLHPDHTELIDRLTEGYSPEVIAPHLLPQAYYSAYIASLLTPVVALHPPLHR